jgi:hypothetical protein
MTTLRLRISVVVMVTRARAGRKDVYDELFGRRGIAELSRRQCPIAPVEEVSP